MELAHQQRVIAVVDGNGHHGRAIDIHCGTQRRFERVGIHAYYEPEELVGKTLLAITNLPPRSMMGIDSCGMLLSAIHEIDGKEQLNLVMLDDKIPAGAKLY